MKQRTSTRQTAVWRISFGLGVAVNLMACSFQAKAFDPFESDRLAQSQLTAPAYPPAHFMVLSDPHLFDAASLGSSGAAFSAVQTKDGKMYRESAEILDSVLGDMRSRKPDFVLVPGDLTKDGEQSAHRLMAEKLRFLTDAGIKVFVVPGNHDIWDAKAQRFDGDQTTTVPGTAPSDFAQIYQADGYGQALARDPSSLSYLAEPVPGLWLFALDSCDYEASKAKGYPVISGRIRQSTITWLEPWLSKAMANHKAVIVMHHHGVLPHVPGLDWVAPQYLLSNWLAFSRFLASYGVRYDFTGHLHSNDIVAKRWNDSLMLNQAAYGHTLFDIETGSLVTYPIPYRDCHFDVDGRLTIHTLRVTTIPSYAAAGLSLPEHGQTIIRRAVARIMTTSLSTWMPPADQAKLLPIIENLLIGHYQGDEKPSPANELDARQFSFGTGLGLLFTRQLIDGLRQDSFPPDNDVELRLDGSAKALDRL